MKMSRILCCRMRSAPPTGAQREYSRSWVCLAPLRVVLLWRLIKKDPCLRSRVRTRVKAKGKERTKARTKVERVTRVSQRIPLALRVKPKLSPKLLPMPNVTTATRRDTTGGIAESTRPIWHRARCAPSLRTMLLEGRTKGRRLPKRPPKRL